MSNVGCTDPDRRQRVLRHSADGDGPRARKEGQQGTQHPGAGQRHQVSGIPTLVLFQAGRERDRLVGAHPAPAIESLLRRATSAPRA